ncbi:hypothetical protein [Bacillus sp. MMSF_3353]|uniref:hypothetical protein n=1 Tax=Bacillus sp. MMSF_3353 TaxID=3047081 RepID=UPI00273F8F95|nr:hypothetical protein [Bacillus sp. MMSF_3353]
MYNNYWNPNQDMMYQNSVPNVDPNNSFYLNTGRNNMFDSSNFHGVGFNNNNQIQYQTYPTNNELKREYRMDLDVPVGMVPPENDLGNGFFRFTWENRTIDRKQILPVTIHAGSLNVINAGYGIQGLGDAMLVESLPKDKNTWYMTVQNLSDAQRKIGFYLIAKR